MKNKLYLLLLAVLLSVSCNKDENIVDPVSDPGTVDKPVIQLVSPNGGEILRIGDAKGITWTYTGTSKLRLQYRKAINQPWILISENLSNTGSFLWSPIPDAASDSCSIRIVDMSDTTVADPSDGLIRITAKKAISVLSPNGGEVLTAKTSATIRWSSANVNTVKIEFSTNNGSSWNLLKNAIAAQNQSFVWSPIPDTATNQYRIRVSDTSEDSIADISDQSFTVVSTQAIQIQRPYFGLNLFNGIKDTIRWTSTDVPVVKIEYTTNNGLNWTVISSATPTGNPITWTPASNPVSSICKIRISDATDNIPSIESDVFAIGNKPAVLVLSPNGGEQLIADSSYTITWSATSSTSSPNGSVRKNARIAEKDNDEIISSSPNSPTTSTVRIELSTDAGSTWKDIISNVSNSGSYLWKPIPQLNSTTCKLRISDAQDATLFDVSDGNFTIKTPTLTLLTPLGNEQWEAGTTQSITWTSSGVDFVKIDLSTDGGVTFATIRSSSMASLGSYSWSIPSSLASTKCRVRISDLASTVSDASRNNFVIAPLPKVTVTKPNGTETVPAGGSYDINWTSENLSKVKIEYTTNNGVNWYTITDSTESNGFYRWNPVPIIASTQCRIRISDNRDGIPSDVSDGSFSIATQPQLKLIAPNGGERILAKSSYSVRWNTNPGGVANRPGRYKNTEETEGALSVTNVKLSFTSDGGNIWNTVVNSTSNNGTYEWNPVPDINSALCKVKVQDVNDSSVYDISDTVFVVYKVTKSLQVTAPNGGENITAGSTTNITWSSTVVASVNIDYTTNNGVNWNRMATGTESDGFYEWNPVPSTISSTNCKIRVTDASDSLLYDESNNTFTILPQPAITVLTPNGGESFAAGTTQLISWNSIGIPEVKIEISSNSGATWDTVRTKLSSSGQYQWLIPSINSTLCRIRISNATGGIPSDISDNNFTITTQQPQSVRVTRPNGLEVFTVGAVQNITWSSAGIDTVKIEMTTNNGVNWSTVISKTPSNGLYAWTVPNSVSTNCKIKVSDANDATPSDVSDSSFTIEAQPVVTVTSPNGGERILAGSTYDIRWTTVSKRGGRESTEAITNVKIEFTSDAGSSWSVVAANANNTGLYQWNPVPNISSSQCRVRISDAEDGIPSDISDSNFVIYNQIPQEITVTAPNGGESLVAGQNTNITWNSTGVSNVKIQYSTNNGVNWSTVVDSTESDGFYLWAPIPAVTSTNCKIRISDVGDGIPFDESNNTFAILPAPSLAVLSPNGGESFIAGTVQTISWTSQSVANVKIELTLNNGASWDSVIVNSTLSNGTYQWTVPAVNSTLCRIRISNATGGIPSDISDNNFTITIQQPQSVRVTRPNGLEVFTVGAVQNITWSSAGIDTVKIEMTTNNGVNWSTVISKTPSNGLYAWTVPNSVSTNCKIKVSDANDATPSDVSDSSFTIEAQPVVTVTSPNGGERILAGSTYDIRWTTVSKRGGRESTEAITNVKIEFTSDAGSSWSVVASNANNTGLYQWNPVPNISSSQCRVRISDAEDGIPSDISDSNFVIYNQIPQEITVTAPNGGESLVAGQNTNITWNSTGVSNVKIQYSTNNGVNWSTVVDSTESDGFYLWAPIPAVTSTNCKIRISDVGDGIPFDESNNTFAILPAPSLAVLSPNGGESFIAGTVQTISWTSQSVANVKIELTLNNGASWDSVIVNSTLSNGTYQWTVPAVNSTLCRIRISNATGGIPSDISDNNFTITTQQPQSVRVTRPNGLEVFTVGAVQNITWSSAGIDTVKIEMTTNNGVNWSTVISKTPSNGLYAWTVPNSVSTNCKIKVSDANDATPSDVSDSSFTIEAQPVVTVTTPNGGERILAGSTYDIRWTTVSKRGGRESTEAITNVKIEFTSDAGSSWSVVASNANNTGLYQWNPVPNISSSQCRVRISDAEDGIPSDISDSNFVIYNQIPQEITVTAPNGGESLVAGQNTNITWNSTGVSNVKIQYSTNNGVNWSTVIDSTESDGFYLWAPIPAVTSTNCKIRISDVGDGIPFDESNNTFAILPAPSLAVLSPNGGESFIAGTVQTISWTSQSVANVKIELTLNNGASWDSVIVNSTLSNGTYQWTVPAVNSTLCRIRISNATGGIPSDISDNNFTITTQQPQSVRVTRPNGLEVFTVGAVQNITWSSAGIDTVKIEMTTNNGVNWSTVISKTPSNGLYAWTVPNSVSTNCKIKVSDANDATPADVSDSSFTIEAQPVVTITTPNGGERILAGSTYDIRWTTVSKRGGRESTEAITNVKIEFTSDAGSSWSVVASNANNTGLYQWNPVPNISSSQCRVRISDAEDGIPSDISDSNFVIYREATQTLTITSPNGGEILNSGGSTDISWNSSGVSSVNIEFSSNNGVSWNVIVNGTESDGFYTWNSIPSISSTNCKIRIYDAADSIPTDESNNTFTILPPPGITVISPNGGEQYITGEVKQILWSSTNIASVKIQLTTNNGASWISVVDSTESDGNYAWTIPSINSSLCKIRISDKVNGIPLDESNAVFSLYTSVPQQVTVLLPNGGEQLAPGTGQSITWTSTGIDTVSISYTTNNGQSWTTIVNKTESDGIFIWAPVPNTASSNVKIRISDAVDNNPSDMSDNVFSIIPQQALRITAPNGGDRILAGSTSTITWVTSTKATEDIQNVRIEFSSNEGQTWTTIVNSTVNTGSYNWNPVPNVSSALCRIRISDEVDGNPSDLSDSNFVIYNQTTQTLAVTAPNGGEILSAGSSTNITWNSSGISSVNIEYSTNNGVVWNSIVSGTESDGFYFWSQIPNVSSTNCKVRITDATDSLPFDESDVTFTILPAPSISVIAPNGGQSLIGGQQMNIQWVSSNIAKVKIELTTDNGASWETQVDSTESDGVYLWTIPARNSSLCKLRVSEYKTGNPVDVSDAVFAIATTTPQNITVTSPNGTEIWPSGSARNITWNSTGLDSVKIEFSTNNGVNWSTIAASTLSDGFYTWSPVPSISSTNCVVRISDAADGLPSDVSDAVFTISPEPAISVLSPNGGQIWTSSSSQQITWLSYNLTKVKIEFTTNNGASWSTIADSTESIGSYLWTIPNLNSSLCKIRVSDPIDGVPSDESDSSFTISNQITQSLTVLAPNGGESFEATSSQSITWTSSAINKVKIEFTTNNGLSWSTIVDSTESDGLYEWAPIPNLSSTLCKVRISDASDGTPVDESNATFTVTQVRAITVTYPNGGENLTSGSLYNIRWTSTGVNNVDIDYRVGSAGEWTAIVVNTPSDGEYSWSPTGSSVGYKIRIRDSNNGNTVDESDGSFTVLPEPSVSVTTPNGNVTLQTGSTYSITWISSNLQNVMIELTTNNGANWSTVINSTPSDGIYEWTVPSINSNLCKIRISDTDSLPSDVSDSVFAIYNVSPQTVTVSSPNGSELLTAGNIHNIQWSSFGIDSVKIEFSSDNGQNWSTVIASTPSDGFYPWSVPNSLSSNCKIRVSDAADSFPFDESNDIFRIVPAGLVAVTSPNGGEVLISGEQTTIRWTSFNVPMIDIDFSSNAGASWTSIADSIASTGQFTWTNIPVINSDQCRVRVRDAVDGVPFDTSDANFSIVQSKQLRVVFPNLPTHIVTQDTAFLWYSVGVQRVNLELSLDNGNTWSTIANNVSSTGAYPIVVSAYSASSLARFRVTDASDPTLTDMSDGPFFLGAEPPGKVLNSTYSEKLSNGSPGYLVTYEKNEAANAVLKVSLDDGKTWMIINAGKKTEAGVFITEWEYRGKKVPLFRIE